MSDNGTTHESFAREQTVRVSSDRSFGIVFAAVFLIVALWPLTGGGAARLWSLALAGLFLAAAILVPKALAPLNRAWMRLGLLLHRVTNPLVMGFVFCLAVVPTALIMRALGKDPLRRRFDREARSYWIERNPPGPEPKTMRDQF